MGSEEKIKLTFFHAMAVLGYLPNLKRGLRLAVGAHFWHDFSIKIFFI